MYIQSAQDTTTTRTSANFFPAGEEWKASAVCRLPSTFSALPAFYSRPANTPQQHCTALHCTAQHKSAQLNSERASERQAGISPASRAAGRAAAGTQAHRQAGILPAADLQASEATLVTTRLTSCCTSPLLPPPQPADLLLRPSWSLHRIKSSSSAFFGGLLCWLLAS